MNSDWLTTTLAALVLVGIIATFLGVARADRQAKRRAAAGQPPHFSWAMFIFSIYILAIGIRNFVGTYLYKQYGGPTTWVGIAWHALAVVLLAVGFTFFTNQVRWLIHTHKNRH